VTCTRLEDEGWLADLGATLDPHVEACADCRARRDEYVRITAAVHGAGADRDVPADWKQRTLARLRAAAPATTTAPAPAMSTTPAAASQRPVRDELAERRRGRQIAAAAIVAAAAAAIVLALALRGSRPRPAPAAVALTVAIIDGAGTRRGAEAAVGDTLVLDGRAGGAAHHELRVYRAARELVLRCASASAAPCRRAVDGIGADLRLARPGEYVIVWFVADAPLPEPTGAFDGDLAAVRASGARVAATETVDVR
jgi:hypothetical protein